MVPADLPVEFERQPRRIVCFDLETQKTFDEVGGRHNLSKLGLAVAVTYDTSTSQFRSYTEDQAAELVQNLAQADLVVGFNVLSFDYPVLQPYTDFPLDTLPTVDLLRDVHQQLGFRLPLQALAEATLGTGKSADGLQSVQWFREGQVDKVIEYCQRDVELTMQLYQFGCQRGHLLYWDRRGQMQKVSIYWT
jgi:DEAD/DEAH box helicase domain-containing protein